MTVAQKLRRNTKITMTTRPMVSSSVNCTSSTEARMVVGAVGDDLDVISGGIAACETRQRRLDLVDGVDDVGAGLLEDDQEDAALAVGPGRLGVVGGAVDRLADVADPHRRAVAIGDDDVVPGAWRAVSWSLA